MVVIKNYLYKFKYIINSLKEMEAKKPEIKKREMPTKYFLSNCNSYAGRVILSEIKDLKTKPMIYGSIEKNDYEGKPKYLTEVWKV